MADTATANRNPLALAPFATEAEKGNLYFLSLLCSKEDATWFWPVKLKEVEVC